MKIKYLLIPLVCFIPTAYGVMYSLWKEKSIETAGKE